MGSCPLLQGNLPNPGIKSGSLALQADSLPSEPPGKPMRRIVYHNYPYFLNLSWYYAFPYEVPNYLFLSIYETFFVICCSVAQSCMTVIPWTAACQASLFFTISWSLLKLMSILVMPSNHLILCHPLLLLPLISPSIRVFSSELALRIRWPKHWSFSFSISPFNEYSELISFRINWFDLLAVQRTLKSLLQHHS